MACVSGRSGEPPCKMLKKARLFTRPTLATTSPSRPKSAKTASSPKDALFHGQGRSERLKIVPPSLLFTLFSDGQDEFPAARVECGHSDPPYFSLGEWPRLPFTARIERARFHRARSASKKGTWPLPSLLADFFSILL